MGTITIKYKNKKQLSTLKKVLTALDFEFEENGKFPPYENPSPNEDEWWDVPENFYGVLKAIEEAKISNKIRLTEELKQELFGGID